MGGILCNCNRKLDLKTGISVLHLTEKEKVHTLLGNIILGDSESQWQDREIKAGMGVDSRTLDVGSFHTDVL